jgi:hypothetical protein
MLPVFIRPARIEDKDLFTEWAMSTPGNEVDPAVLKYANTSIRCAFTREKIICFMPVQRPLHMESLAVNPEASELEVAAALRSLLQDVVTSAYAEGSGEIYFVATEETVPELATPRGFKKMPWSVYRVKLSELEGDSDPRTAKKSA